MSQNVGTCTCNCVAEPTDGDIDSDVEIDQALDALAKQTPSMLGVRPNSPSVANIVNMDDIDPEALKPGDKYQIILDKKNGSLGLNVTVSLCSRASWGIWHIHNNVYCMKCWTQLILNALELN